MEIIKNEIDVIKKVESNDTLSDLSDISEYSNISETSQKKSYPIFNEKNKYVEKSFIENILKSYKTNIKVNDLSIWQKALIHKSYSKNNKKYKLDIDIDIQENIDESIMPIQDTSNETLEWLGDAVIQSVVGTYLWKRFPDEDEGFLTKTRSKLVKTETLSKLALSIELDKYIVMSQHVEIICNGRKNARILEDAFEAFIGALLNDNSNNIGNGYIECYEFITNVIEENIDITELILKDDNYKDQLMRYFQKIFNGKFPKYYQECITSSINENGTINKKFHMYVLDPSGFKIGNGIARSKKDAEQKAAKDALNHYGLTNGY